MLDMLLKRLLKKNFLFEDLKILSNCLRKKKPSFFKQKEANIRDLESNLTSKIGLNVSIQNKKNNKGKIILEYKDLDQLNKIIEILKSNY